MKEIHKPALSPGMAMVTDSNGYPTTSSTITSTELNALNGWINDGNGYIYKRITTLETHVWMPDYAAPTTVTSDSVVSEASVGIAAASTSGGGSASVSVDGVTVWQHKCGDGGSARSIGMFMIPAGAVVSFDECTVIRYPLKLMAMSVN